MRWLSTLAIVLGCAACQPQPDGTQVSAVPDQPQPPQGQAQLACHDFTTAVTAGGNPEQASGQACGQPDGSWRVVQNTPGLPAQTYVLPSPGQPAAAAANPAAQAPPNQPPCSSYSAPVTVGGQPQQAIIEACPQPDGGYLLDTDNYATLTIHLIQNIDQPIDIALLSEADLIHGRRYAQIQTEIVTKEKLVGHTPRRR